MERLRYYASMIGELFHTGVYIPLYNGLVFLIGTVPYADVGIALILLTLFVKIFLFPLAQKVAYMQVKMRELAPLIEKIKETHKEDKQQETIKTMELYKEHNVRPFLSILVLFIQLPIIIGLYIVFSRGGLPTIDPSLLYSFVHMPDIINMHFLWVTDLSERSIILALLAGGTQFINSMYVLPKPKPRGDNPTIKDDLAHSLHLQMKYFMPVLIAVIAYTISAAIALYWVTSIIFAIGQELLVRRNMKKVTNTSSYDTSTN